MSKLRQRVGAENPVERAGEHVRHIERGDAHPAPRYRRPGGGEAAQFDLVGRQAAGKAAYLPLKFDLRGLRADALGGNRRQDRPFGAGIEQQSNRHPVGNECNDRGVAQRRDGNLADPTGAAADSSGIRGHRHAPERRREHDGAAQNSTCQGEEHQAFDKFNLTNSKSEPGPFVDRQHANPEIVDLDRADRSEADLDPGI